MYRDSAAQQCRYVPGTVPRTPTGPEDGQRCPRVVPGFPPSKRFRLPFGSISSTSSSRRRVVSCAQREGTIIVRCPIVPRANRIAHRRRTVFRTFSGYVLLQVNVKKVSDTCDGTRRSYCCCRRRRRPLPNVVFIVVQHRRRVSVFQVQ